MAHATFSPVSLLFIKNDSLSTHLICSQNLSTEARREAVIRALILYLGEKEEDLFEDCWVKHDFISQAQVHLLKATQYTGVPPGATGLSFVCHWHHLDASVATSLWCHLMAMACHWLGIAVPRWHCFTKFWLIRK